MDQQHFIYHKLEAFIRKYYINELIKGIIFFVGLGLMYLFFTLFVEYILWLKPIGRSVLFFIFISIELYFLSRFILFPLFKLFKLQKGIDYNQVSLIIGNHFSDVKDKLINFLQLSDSETNPDKSELLMASIEQKANSLRIIPFSNAITFRANQKYLPLLIVPIIICLFIFISDVGSSFSQSLNRVVHFTKPFSPPAPFDFVVLNPILQTEQNKDFVLRVATKGKIIPENVMIFIGDESYFMETIEPGIFQYKIFNPSSNVDFHLVSNAVSSQDYELKVFAIPSISNFVLQLVFPKYLNKKPELITGTGNAIIPEGTQATWKIKTQFTDNVVFNSEKTSFSFSKVNTSFVLSKSIFQNTDYQIITSNNKANFHEKLNYRLSVIKDQFPTISLNQLPESIKSETNYLVGKVADDYGLSKLQIVYYEKDKLNTLKRAFLPVKKSVFDQFVFSFPANLPVNSGVSYEYYFEVFDTDELHHFKSTKSTIYSNRIATETEKQDQLLQLQNENISGFQKSIKNQNNQFSALDKLEKNAKQKESSDYKDKQNLNEFIKKQQNQDEILKLLSTKIKDNLDQMKSSKKDEFKEELQKRIENSNKDLEKNKNLLDELNALNDKIRNEDLQEKLSKFKQNSKNQIKNLEQLVELTKKYYVQKKSEQIADKLNQLSEKQLKLSENEKENTINKQDDINNSFKKIQEDFTQLNNENNDLKSPTNLPNSSEKQKNIDNDLKKASDELSKKNQKSASKPQKSASKQMKQIAQSLKEAMNDSDQEKLEEDVKMLRQILDNLLAYSYAQESLMFQFKHTVLGSPAFNKYIKSQQNLKTQFKHIDDSLFSMSLRNPKIAENITKEIGNVQYNIDNSIISLSDSKISKGFSHQQYAISSSNKLADLLSETLSNMQMSLSGSQGGKPKPGQGDGMQLSDIIKKQDQIGQKLKEGLSGSPQSGQGKNGKSGDKNQNSPNKNAEAENNSNAILEIFKEQQQLRESLENELNKKGLGSIGNSSLDQMKQLEKQLLNKGFTNTILQNSTIIKQELLKLKTAFQEQGQENTRQSTVNKNSFFNQSKSLPLPVLDYLNSIEILNRQSLPLQSNFNRKVQEYFKKND